MDLSKLATIVPGVGVGVSLQVAEASDDANDSVPCWASSVGRWKMEENHQPVPLAVGSQLDCG